MEQRRSELSFGLLGKSRKIKEFILAAFPGGIHLVQPEKTKEMLYDIS